MKKILTIFSLAGALIIGGSSLSSTITGAEIETPDQLPVFTRIDAGAQSSQISEERAEAQQEQKRSHAVYGTVGTEHIASVVKAPAVDHCFEEYLVAPAKNRVHPEAEKELLNGLFFQ